VQDRLLNIVGAELRANKRSADMELLDNKAGMAATEMEYKTDRVVIWSSFLTRLIGARS
jgi:hypothetical protein